MKVANKDSLLREVEVFSFAIINGISKFVMVYHTIDHTIDVVSNAKKMGLAHKLTAAEIEILMIAACFHDAGYVNAYISHENEGATIAEQFLRKKGKDDSFISQVKNCILATKTPQNPKDLLSSILCDADLKHVSDRSFWQKSLLLKQEWELNNIKTYDSLSFLEISIEFLLGHQFKTFYAKEHFEPGKIRNIRSLTKMLEDRPTEKEIINHSG